MEDRALAACDDQYLGVRTAQIIISSWFDRHVPTRELRTIYRKLSDLGLLRVYVRRRGRIVRSPFLGCRTLSLLARATEKGRVAI